MSDLCPGFWVAAAARRPQGRSWGQWRRCTSGWWRRCRRGAAACPCGWWSPAGTACRGGTSWRSGRSSEASEIGPSWWDWAGEGHVKRWDWAYMSQSNLRPWCCNTTHILEPLKLNPVLDALMQFGLQSERKIKKHQDSNNFWYLICI